MEDHTESLPVLRRTIVTTCYAANAARRALLNEDVVVLRAWNQTITLILPDAIDQIDNGDIKKHRENDGGPPLLRELDGNLPWPGRRKRRYRCFLVALGHDPRASVRREIS
jgi:hypothetical protein